MASGMTEFVIGKALLFGLWAASLCAGGLLPPIKSSYLMPNGTVNGVASGNLSFSSSSSPSPTEYWCFDTFDLSYMECCGLGDPGDDCKHAAAVCFDQVECQDGCELDLAQGIAAESGATSFSCPVPTETCATAVTTRNDDGVPTTSSILSCAATATTIVVAVTAASVTQTSLGSNHTGGHVGSSQASVESAVSKTTTGNSTKLTMYILPGLLPTSQALTSTLTPSSFISSQTTYPPAITSTTEATHTTPVPTSSALPLTTNTTSATPLWQNSGIISGLAMGGFMVILAGFALFFEIEYIREMNQKKKQEELEMRLTQRLHKKEKNTSTNNIPGGPAGVALFAPPKKQQKTSQDRGPFDGKKDGDGDGSSSGGNKEKVTASSSSRTASFNAEIVAALAASETGVLYDSSGDMRCADFSVPCLRDRNSDNKNNTTSSGGGGKMEARHTDSVEPKSSCSFESCDADAMNLSEVGEIQEATAVRYYSPHAGQGQQIVQLSKRD